MDFLNRMERKFGRYAIHNLMLYIIILNAAGFIMCQLNAQLWTWTCWSMGMILQGQVWRLVTFIMTPFDTNILSFLLFAIVYYSIGQSLERAWGAFRLNVYIFTGLLGHILAGVLVYFLFGIDAYLMSTSYLNTSLFLALAMTFPDAQFLLFFIIPIKAKWMGLISVGFLVYNLIIGTAAGRLMIVVSLLNFALFFLLYGKNSRFNPKDFVRRSEFRRKAGQTQHQTMGRPLHKCAICGRTDRDFPNLEFRYCSKCSGAYEYCMEHLYTHIHVTDQTKTGV